MLVEPMTDAHAGAVLAIYQSGIDEGNATFENPAASVAGFLRSPASRPPFRRH